MSRKSVLQLCAVVCLAALLAPAAAGAASGDDGVPASYRAALAAAGIPLTAASIVVRALDGGPLELRAHSAAPVSPASTMKLVTSYAALGILGSAYTWNTQVLARGARREDLLDGDLVLRGGGDPGMVIERFWLLVQRVRALGIREIRGDLLLDRSAYAPVAYDPQAFDGADTRAYNAGPDPLLVNFNAVSYELRPDEAAGLVRVTITPAVSRSAAATVPAISGPCGDWRAQLRLDLGNPLDPVFRGNYPSSCGIRTIHALAPDPDAYVERVFRVLWENSGGIWRGRARGTPGAVAGARLLLDYESRPLGDVVHDMNKFSNNVMARMVFLSLAREESPEPATAARAAAVVRRWLASRGIAAPELVLENGAGLSRLERVSANTLAALLADAYASPWMPELMSSLPVVGVDGTMKTRRAAAGSAHIKTGLLQGVRAIAGYVRAQSGRRYVVVAIVNHRRAAAAGAANDALLQWVYESG